MGVGLGEERLNTELVVLDNRVHDLCGVCMCLSGGVSVCMHVGVCVCKCVLCKNRTTSTQQHCVCTMCVLV